MEAELPNNQRSARVPSYDHEERLLDDVNLRILAELRDNPRLPMAELARRFEEGPFNWKEKSK